MVKNGDNSDLEFDVENRKKRKYKKKTFHGWKNSKYFDSKEVMMNHVLICNS